MAMALVPMEIGGVGNVFVVKVHNTAGADFDNRSAVLVKIVIPIAYRAAACFKSVSVTNSVVENACVVLVTVTANCVFGVTKLLDKSVHSVVGMNMTVGVGGASDVENAE